MLEVVQLNSTAAMPKSLRELPHILLVVDQFPRILGGGERVALELAEQLPRYGFRASVLTFSAHPECLELRDSTSPLYVLPLRRTYGVSAIRAAFVLRRFLLEQEVCLVQTFFESSDLWAGVVTKALTGVKLIWSRRDMGILRERKHAVAYRLLSHLPDRVFAVSEKVRQCCISQDGIDPRRVETVFNGLDLSKWRPVAQPAQSPQSRMVTTVGNMRRVKGHDIFVRAAGVLASRFPDVHFTIAGGVLEPEYYSELQQMVNELGLNERFHFVGAVANLRKHLADATIFVLPSRSEGFSNAIIEAMATGLPVVATDVGGNAEAVEDGVSGIVVPAEDISALTEAIADLLDNPQRAQRMGEAGKTRVSKMFSVDAMMSHTVKVYRMLLAEQ